MVNEHVDPVYKYVDHKIRLVKRDLQQLKKAYDAVTAEQKKMLLETQRDTASFIVLSTFTMSTINLPEKYHDQLVILTTAARAKIDTSDAPLPIATDYYHECCQLLNEAGIKILNFG